jgi:hypothetical protein
MSRGRFEGDHRDLTHPNHWGGTNVSPGISALAVTFTHPCIEN